MNKVNTIKKLKNKNRKLIKQISELNKEIYEAEKKNEYLNKRIDKLLNYCKELKICVNILRLPHYFNK